MKKRSFSLKTRLIIASLLLQFMTIAASSIIIILLLVYSTVDGMYADQTAVEVASRAIIRSKSGHPIVKLTPELAELKKEAPDLWFIARLDDGSSVAFGQVPTEFFSIGENLHKFSSADIHGQFAPYTLSALIRRQTGPAGDMTIAAHGSVYPFTLLITLASNFVAIGLFLALASVSIVATPIVVRRALAGVTKTVHEAERIDVESRGIRLSEEGLPREISSLVRAINEALGRLDEGYQRQARFIASAAHELRTPIAILRIKLDATDQLMARSLLGDVSRLANLAEQLLDIHRLDNGAPCDPIDLIPLARRVAAELAPMLITVNKIIEVVVERPGAIVGNAGSIERVLTNLVQNAVEHGGDQIVVRVDKTSLEVEDNGSGIPLAERDRVFEPFHRLRPRSSGTGLGLNLVQQVMAHHRGRVAILDAPNGGTIVRVEFLSAG